jgi:hypothetical protein
MAIDNMPDCRPVYREMASVIILASDPLSDAIVVLVFPIGYDDRVGRPHDLEDLLWYWHGVPLKYIV